MQSRGLNTYVFRVGCASRGVGFKVEVTAATLDFAVKAANRELFNIGQAAQVETHRASVTAFFATRVTKGDLVRVLTHKPKIKRKQHEIPSHSPRSRRRRKKSRSRGRNLEGGYANGR